MSKILTGLHNMHASHIWADANRELQMDELSSIGAQLQTLTERYDGAISETQSALKHLTAQIDRLLMDQSNYQLLGVIPNGLHARMDPATDIISLASLQAFSGEIGELYVELTRDLDSQSRAVITRVLRRLRDYTANQATLFQITREEEAAYRILLDYHYNRLLPLAEGWFLYDGKWYLPSSEISSTVFYYRHFLPQLDFPERLRKLDIIDIGAHMGDSAIILSEFTDAAVWSFEPSPRNFRLLQKTIERNKLDKVKAFPVALGATSGSSAITEQGDMSRLTSHGDGEAIQVLTLDEFVSRNQMVPGLVKIDVEGSELDVLAGAEQTIRHFRPVLVLSIYHNFDQFFGTRKWVESLDLGYRFKIRKPDDLNIAVDLNLICEPESEIGSRKDLV